MTHDSRIAMSLSQLYSIYGLGDGPYLVHLDQNTIGHSFIDTLLEDLRIGDEKVVPNQLDLVTERIGEIFPAIPVLFRHPILDGDDGVFVDPGGPVVHHLIAGQLLAATLVEFVLAVFEHFAAGGIEGNTDLATHFIPRRFDGLQNGL